MVFADVCELQRAYDTRQVDLNAKIAVRIREFEKIGRWRIHAEADSSADHGWSCSVVGNSAEGIAVLVHQQGAEKKEISRLINGSFRRVGLRDTVIFADHLMYTGFAYATRGGISICVDDMLVPTQKQDLLAAAEKKLKKSRCSTPRV